MREKRDLVRVVRTPDGDIGIDPTGKMNGRGAYLCRDWSCLRAALKRKGLERAFKTPLPPNAALALEAGFRCLVPDERRTPEG